MQAKGRVVDGVLEIKIDGRTGTLDGVQQEIERLDAAALLPTGRVLRLQRFGSVLAALGVCHLLGGRYEIIAVPTDEHGWQVAYSQVPGARLGDLVP